MNAEEDEKTPFVYLNMLDREHLFHPGRDREHCCNKIVEINSQIQEIVEEI